MQHEDISSSTVIGKKKRRHKKNKKSRVAISESSASQKETIKRSYSEDECASDKEKVVKKKKKTKLVPIEAGKSGAKSIRQQKRERHIARIQDAEFAAKDALKEQCIEYLSAWKHNKGNWKFMKVKQLWLYKNKFSSKLIPDSMWQVFLEYFSSAQGNVKNLLLEDSKKIIEKMDAFLEKEQKSDVESEETISTPLDKPDDVSYKRARDIIQYLEE